MGKPVGAANTITTHLPFEQHFVLAGPDPSWTVVRGLLLASAALPLRSRNLRRVACVRSAPLRGSTRLCMSAAGVPTERFIIGYTWSRGCCLTAPMIREILRGKKRLCIVNED